MKRFILFFSLCFTLAAVAFSQQKTLDINYTETAPVIDGDTSDAVWGVKAAANPIEIEVKAPDPEIDLFSAYFKLLWNDTAIFYMVYVEDEFLDTTSKSWKDDRLEIYYHFGDYVTIEGGNIAEDTGYYQVPVYVSSYEGDGKYFHNSELNHSVSTIDENVSWVIEGYTLWDHFKTTAGDTVTPDIANGYSFHFDIGVMDQDDGDLGGNPSYAEQRRVYWSSTVPLFDGVAGVFNADSTWEGLAADVTLVNKPVNVNTVTADNSFNYYPNPVEDNITIKGANNIEVLDLVGKKVLSVDVNSNTVSLSTLESGLYIVNFYNDGQLIETGKIYKN